ncbi:prealbumin-like fold domain-containing protein [Nocardia asteroides]|uniref:prealbumin-like fold domain-containing protein n=1 Tax=Nocardia asteroides TaxID=1824 RepID=UPI0011089641
MAAAALTVGAVSAASAHPGADDSVGQSTTCGTEHLRDDLLLHAPGAAATGQIDAVLIESRTRGPVAGGKVVLTGVDACGDTIHRHLSTGADGQVSFRGLQPGRYQVTAYPAETTARPISSADVELSTPSRKTLQFTVGTHHE